jgi:hypothetical protein
MSIPTNTTLTHHFQEVNNSNMLKGRSRPVADRRAFSRRPSSRLETRRKLFSAFALHLASFMSIAPADSIPAGDSLKTGERIGESGKIFSLSSSPTL